jgi:hypothetical protein
MQENFQDAEIGVAQARPLDALRRVREQRLECFHENEPEMNSAGILFLGGSFLLHSKLSID